MNHSALLGVIGLGNENWWRVASLGLLTGEPFLLCLSQFPSYLDAKQCTCSFFSQPQTFAIMWKSSSDSKWRKRANCEKLLCKFWWHALQVHCIIRTYPYVRRHYKHLTAWLAASIVACRRQRDETARHLKVLRHVMAVGFIAWCESETATPQTGPLCTYVGWSRIQTFPFKEDLLVIISINCGSDTFNKSSVLLLKTVRSVSRSGVKNLITYSVWITPKEV